MSAAGTTGGAIPGGGVAEIAGLHGAFSFPERLLQQIWLRGDFDARALKLRDGRPVKLLRRGRWNRLAGPDFADAELVVGEGAAPEVWRGAVEVHLRAVDWDQHGHAADPAYDGVVLHVVLFPSMREWTLGSGGRRIPILELLPLLERDLEAYAEEAAVEGIAGRPYSQLREALAEVSAETLRAEVVDHAGRRWESKVRFAGQRIARLGWEEACHCSALEVLGYRPNRVPMLKVAEALPLADWREAAEAGPDDWTEWVAEAMRVAEGEWVSSGVRPANHPRHRLGQYARWVAASPRWPGALIDAVAELVQNVALDATSAAAPGGVCADEAVAGVRASRRSRRVRQSRERLAETICGDVLGGTRFDTMVCDAWLPLLAARAEAAEETAFAKTGASVALGRLWATWTPGDAPAELLRLAREFRVSGAAGEPLRQGDLQGLLGWLAALAPRDGRGA